MGDKRLKAIAVRGTKDIHIARPYDFYSKCEYILSRTPKLKEFVDDYSHNRITGHVNKMMYGNMEENIPWPEVGDVHQIFLSKYRARRQSCFNCNISCKSSIRLPDATLTFVKCFPWVLFMSAFKIMDFNFGLKCYNLCERYGLDSVSTSNACAFIIDLYKKKYVNKGHTEGKKLEWRDANLAFYMIRKIAKKEGIGKLLANGVDEAAKIIGRGAEKYSYHIKKLEIYPYELNVPYLAYTAAVSDKDLIKSLGEVLQHRLPTSKQSKQAYLDSGFFPYPKDFEKFLWDPIDWSGADYERQKKHIDYDTDKITFADCTGNCIFLTGHWPYAPYSLNDLAVLVENATGMRMDESRAIKISKRIRSLMRAYNVMAGATRDDDTVPEHFFTKVPSPPKVNLNKEIFNKFLDTYYEDLGWNNNGVPTQKTLDELNLNHIGQELKGRGIINGDKNEKKFKNNKD
jgi:aldehyde:ferredoxin oxidoreductase